MYDTYKSKTATINAFVPLLVFWWVGGGVFWIRNKDCFATAVAVQGTG